MVAKLFFHGLKSEFYKGADIFPKSKNGWSLPLPISSMRTFQRILGEFPSVGNITLKVLFLFMNFGNLGIPFKD